MKNIKKIIVYIYIFLFLFFSLYQNVFAETTYSDLIKKDVYTIEGNKLLYRVETHQGKMEDIHNEVVLMIDASTSNGANWNKVKSMLIGIGDELLDGSGRYQITLMGFGFSDKIVKTGIKSKEELNETLEDPNLEFLYGRSSTNCESGLVGVKEYLESINDLNEATVIFISDSAANMSDEEIPWENWSDDENASWRYNKYSVEVLSLMFLQDYELVRIIETGKPAPATEEILKLNYKTIVKRFLTEEAVNLLLVDKQTQLENLKTQLKIEETPELLEKIKIKETEIKNIKTILINFKYGVYEKDYIEELAPLIEEVLYSKTNMNDTILNEIDEIPGLWRKWTDKIWEDVYKEAGLIYGQDKAYPISDIEQAFVDYDKKNNTLIEDAFYIMIFGYIKPNKFVDNYNSGYRASQAANTLAEMENVIDLYMIGYGGSAEKSWMNPNSGHKNAVTNEKIQYLHLNNVEESLEISKPITDNIETTGFHDLTVTDYLSKWGILQLNTIKIYNGDKIIYQYNEDTETYEWLIPEDERPVKSDNPVKVENLTPEEIEQANDDIKGNTNGDIYKIIWKIKDGELFKTDNYRIEYEVSLDIDEQGFTFGEEYPINGISTLGYGFNKENKTESIDIPTISITKQELLPNNPNTKDNIYKSIITFTICFSIQSLLLGNYLINKKRKNEKA